MHLELMRDAAKKMPEVDDAASVDSLTVWHCKYQTLEAIGAFKALRTLKIATFPDETFDFLAGLPNLEWLSVTHLPKVSDLSSVAALGSIRFLELQTLPSWDSSSQRSVVATLTPLRGLSLLEHISLIGVVPETRSLAPLEECKSLKSAKFHGYPAGEVKRFFAASAIANAHIPPPVA